MRVRIRGLMILLAVCLLGGGSLVIGTEDLAYADGDLMISNWCPENVKIVLRHGLGIPDTMEVPAGPCGWTMACSARGNLPDGECFKMTVMFQKESARFQALQPWVSSKAIRVCPGDGRKVEIFPSADCRTIYILYNHDGSLFTSENVYDRRGRLLDKLEWDASESKWVSQFD